MAENIDEIRVIFNELRIESVNQLNLRVTIHDKKYLNQNPFSIALFHEKFKVLEFLLDNDYIDIMSCCKKTPLTINEKKSGS